MLVPMRSMCPTPSARAAGHGTDAAAHRRWTLLGAGLALLVWTALGWHGATAHADEHDDDESPVDAILDPLKGDDEDEDDAAGDDGGAASGSGSEPEAKDDGSSGTSEKDASKVQAAGDSADPVDRNARRPTRGAAAAPRLSVSDVDATDDGEPVTLQAPAPSVAPPEQVGSAPPRVVSVGVSAAMLPDVLARDYGVPAASTGQLLVALCVLLVWYRRRQRSRFLPKY